MTPPHHLLALALARFIRLARCVVQGARALNATTAAVSVDDGVLLYFDSRLQNGNLLLRVSILSHWHDISVIAVRDQVIWRVKHGWRALSATVRFEHGRRLVYVSTLTTVIVGSQATPMRDNFLLVQVLL